MVSTTRKTLKSRPLDLLYFTFFLIHIPASLLVDFQAIYPASLIPSLIKAIPPWYVAMSGDPLMGGALGMSGNTADYAWFKMFLYLEAAFQFPVFILGARGLWKDSRGIYTLLLIYGASTSTATLACLAALLNTPATSPATVAAGVQSVTPSQLLMLLSSYVPFFLLPLGMTLDMAFRVHGLATKGATAQKSTKAN